MGNSTAARSPVFSDRLLRKARGSSSESAIHSGSPDCHAAPTSPTPWRNTMSREASVKLRAASMSGAAHSA